MNAAESKTDSIFFLGWAVKNRSVGRPDPCGDDVVGAGPPAHARSGVPCRSTEKDDIICEIRSRGGMRAISAN